MRRWPRGFPWLRPLAALAAASLVARPELARSLGAPTLVVEADASDPSLVRRIRTEIGRRRVLVDPAALPAAESASTERVAAEQRRIAVQLSLERAKKRESEAEWDACVKEAAGAMSDAIDMVQTLGDLGLVRELHLQAGACMSLAGQVEGARLHYLAASLIDESPAPSGLHREEAEAAERQALQEVINRPRGRVRIATEPSGAEVWIDGHLIPGRTPLETDVRLGDHFVTVRRFRYEPNTEQRLLQPSGSVRVALEPAHRETLREQLASVERGAVKGIDQDEMLLALGAWSRAEQIVVLSRASKPVVGLSARVLDVSTARPLGTSSIPSSTGAGDLRQTLCGLLGEVCEPERGIAWYVWPLAGAALVGAAVATGLIIENQRTTRFCPPSGCR